jgi:hypothetical protein
MSFDGIFGESRNETAKTIYLMHSLLPICGKFTRALLAHQIFLDYKRKILTFESPLCSLAPAQNLIFFLRSVFEVIEIFSFHFFQNLPPDVDIRRMMVI